MATEQTEAEQEYELGDPSGQATGFDMDTDDDDDIDEMDLQQKVAASNEEPFTDMNQFETYETSEELLTALQEASEDNRKERETRVKQGGRMPRGGIPY